MKPANIIPLDPKARVLEKVKGFINDLGSFLADTEAAVPVLIRGLGLADDDLKVRILLLMGGFGRPDIAGALHQVMADPTQSETVRGTAAVQLCVTAPNLHEPGLIVRLLLSDVESKDPVLRAHAALALGWEDNTPGVLPLIELLYDPDGFVQQAAVNALANIGDERVFYLLSEKAVHGSVDQKRAVLNNLWRYPSRTHEAAEVYRRCIRSERDASLRYDALLLLERVAMEQTLLSVYRECLTDDSPRVRDLARRRLGEKDKRKGGNGVAGQGADTRNTE